MTTIKPILLYDGDCGFCRRWIFRWRHWTEGLVDYAPWQEAGGRFPEISNKQFGEAVQLVDGDGKIYGGAEAVFRALACSPRKRWMLAAYRSVPGVKPVTDSAYRFIAAHRPAFSRLTRIFWGDELEPSQYFIGRWLFLRSMGVIYLSAFLSLYAQLDGLFGADGISPARDYIKAVAEQAGPVRYWLMPTVFWLNSSDAFMHAVCAAGALLSALLIAGIAPRAVLFLLWALYLSFVGVGQDFLAFQWDNLLLETGFLAIFAAPRGLWPKWKQESQPPGIAIFALWFLLFKLMFSSGCVKLLSGDPAWRDWTALCFHYETQPLPTWIGWWAHQLPAAAQKASVAGMFLIELVAPFLLFFPRRARIVSAAAISLLMTIIFLTGNYAFFNFLTIALCFLAVDDAAWTRLGPRFIPKERPSGSAKSGWAWAALPTLVTAMSFIQIGSMLWPGGMFRPLENLTAWAMPLRTVNHYGLFAVMTTRRIEIEVEGSDDGKEWKPYEFKWKPGNPGRRPGFVEPHQPRLDWQMWFAALGSYENNPWFVRFLVGLLRGSPSVIGLLKANPFPAAPPKYIRALVYEYHFTDIAARRSSGDWWRREFKGLYCPVASLK